MVLLRLFYIIIFFWSVYYSLKFEWSAEGKDERGQAILNASYGIALPVVPLGWLVIELTNDYVYALSYEEYQTAIWFLVTGVFIIHAITLVIRRRSI
mgnify:CR=1 FL=1